MLSRALGRPILWLLGLLSGLLLWAGLLGAQFHPNEPGLWTIRFARVLDCGFDYNGPPYIPQPALWFTCGETDAWPLWPLRWPFRN